ncbi:MAG TPA: GNAT family N-acetyltransferase [Candidatus Rubrimentiphilum sp.]|nr:GNAT family N-acetyltransferase [Candidatus Rubrimentiphilum sp.]
MQLPPDELGASVREALIADVPRLVALASQLGYDVTPKHIEKLLRLPSKKQSILVAVVPRAGVVGWVAVAEHESIISARRAEIEGLVVEDEFRGHRIGALLVKSAEEWGRRRGCTTLRLLSNVVRDRAHSFYEDLGYTLVKTQHAFQKNL